MNKVILIGNIAKELELQKTQSGTSSCRMSLAVNRDYAKDGDTKVDFIECRVYGKSAENLIKYQRKGNKVMVEGSLRIDKYKTGEDTKYYTSIFVDRVEFLSSAQKPEKVEESELFTEIEDVKKDEEDLPF